MSAGMAGPVTFHIFMIVAVLTAIFAAVLDLRDVTQSADLDQQQRDIESGQYRPEWRYLP